MRKLAFILAFASLPAHASSVLYIPNLSEAATGTDVGGKQALDVNVANALSIDTSGLATEAKQDDIISALGAPAQEHATAVSPSSTRLSDGSAFYKATTPSDTQPVSAASLPLPTGAATAAKQPALGTAGSASSDVITVQGISSMTALKVDGSAVTQPVSISGNQAVNLTQVAGASVGTGHGTASGAIRVELPTDGTGVVNVNNVSGTVSLPTGAATAANQSTGNTSLGNIDTSTSGLSAKFGSLGQKAMTGSAPVVIASDQSAIPTKAPLSVTGSGSAAAATVSTVATLTAPASAVGFILMNLDTSTANIRWAVGRTASTTLGQQLQPGRDTGFVPVGANVSVIAESGTQNIDIQWVSQ